MSEEYVWLGSAPGEESCAQVGSEGYHERALAECRQYIEAIRRKCGPPPEGVVLRVKSQPHDFGTYYEVVAAYSPDNADAAEYAFRVEREAPVTWEEVGMTSPAIRSSRGR